MKYLLVILLAAVSLGFMVETPETIKQREKEDRARLKQIKEEYDLKALHRFLEEQLKANPNVKGVDLSRARIARKWTIEGKTLHCGEWTLDPPDPKTSEFTISWTYEDKPNADRNGGIWKSILLICHRKSKNVFILLSVKHSEDEYITLTP